MQTIRKGYTNEEVARIAVEMYERDIKPAVEPDHNGEYLVLDIESGGYVIDRDQVAAMLRAAERYPDGIRHGFRVGYRTTGRIGSRLKEREGV